MMKHLEDTDKAFGDNMSRLSGDMDKLIGAITAGFSLLQKMLSEPLLRVVQSHSSGGHSVGSLQNMDTRVHMATICQRKQIVPLLFADSKVCA